MCHHGQHIWILYTNGCIAVLDMKSHKIIQNIKLQDASDDPIAILVVDHSTGLVAAAYSNGLIGYMWDGAVSVNENVPVVYFHSDNYITVSYRSCKLTAVESCSGVDDHCQMWCGYNIGAIQIFNPPDKPTGKTKKMKVLQMKYYCADLESDTCVTQLTFSGKESSLMYALHDEGWVISCWSVNSNPQFH